MIHVFFAQRIASDRLGDLHRAAARGHHGLRYPDAERRPRVASHWANR